MIQDFQGVRFFPRCRDTFGAGHRLNMEVDLQVYLGSMSRDVHSCTHWLRPRNLSHPPALGLVYEGAFGQPR
jgi:hypothetical protein